MKSTWKTIALQVLFKITRFYGFFFILYPCG